MKKCFFFLVSIELRKYAIIALTLEYKLYEDKFWLNAQINIFDK